MLYSILLKGIRIAINLMLVPLMLGYLAEEEYGIWMTLSSMLVWITFFDIGLSNGLRNKLTEALAVGDKKRARIYVSTTFALLIGIISLVFIIFIFVDPLINWAAVFNTTALSSEFLGRVVLITFAFFGLNFILSTVVTVYFAVQRSAIVDFIHTIDSLLSLGILVLLTKLTDSGSLLYAATAFSITTVLVYVAVYFSIFYGRYRFLLPSVKCINLKYTKDLMLLGVNFFLVQISFLILFTSSNFIITQLLGPSEVTTYNIAYKYFSMVTIGFTIILTPLWSAYTDAYAKGEYDWIRNTMRNVTIFWGVCVLGTVLMIVLSPWIYRLWVGEQTAASIPLSLSIACAVYVTISNLNGITTCFLNGVGKVILQLCVSLGAIVIYIPLALYLGKSTGTSGIVYALCIAMLFAAIIQPVQCFKIINKTARGIWNK